MEFNFTYESYHQAIKLYKNSNYTITNFKNYDQNKEKKILLIRHDIDMDIELAKNFAEFENSIGVNSSYFFRFTAKNYNLLSIYVLNTIKAISGLGHEIGLHIDSMHLEEQRAETNVILNVKNLLESQIGNSVESFSIHEPSRTSFSSDYKSLIDIGLKNNCYSKKFFEDIKYISDSGGRWREGHFGEWVDKVEKLQVLTHPLWWYKERPQENY